ncbi:MAG: nucleotidyltransferase domain-containing protein [Candidatus Margulisiibacteriota bacterium]
MDKKEIIHYLQEFKRKTWQQYHIQKIGLFGSVARDEASDNSDIDIVVEIMEPDLFILADIKTDLEKHFGRHVDVVRKRKTMSSLFRERIEKDVIYAG